MSLIIRIAKTNTFYSKAVEKLSEKVPVVFAPNMSLGVNVTLELIKEAARLLKGYDIELVETHHNMKKDAPSGTAMAMAEAAATLSESTPWAIGIRTT